MFLTITFSKQRGWGVSLDTAGLSVTGIWLNRLEI